jgi:molecular chaperone GrpE (heat shock protein)
MRMLVVTSTVRTEFTIDTPPTDMGTASSLPKTSKKTLRSNLDQERERKYESLAENEELAAKHQLEHEARLAELKYRNEELEDSIIKMKAQMKLEAERWQQEKSDTLHMIFSKWVWPLMSGGG